MSRSTFKYLLLLAVAHVLYFWKTLLTNQFTLLAGRETVSYTYSWLTFWVRSLWQGRFPLWDPYAFCGRPFAGEMLPSAYYPLHLLLLLVPFNNNGLFSPRLYHEGLAATHLLGAYFMFALLREFRLSRLAAFVGACCFSLSSMICGMPWPPFLEAYIWLPAIFLFVLRALRTESAGAALTQASLGGVCFGMSILTGGLHFSIMQGIAAVTAVIYHGLAGQRSAAVSARDHWRRVALILALVLVVGGGLGAVQLLPGWEFGKLSMRFIDGGAVPATEKIPYHRLNPGLWPQSILTPLFPAAYGTVAGGEFFGMYIGVLPFLLAIAAIRKCWNNLWVRYMAGLALFAWLYALGAFSLLHGVVYAVVPLLWVVRVTSRFAYLSIFGLSVLAAIGLDRLLDRSAGSAGWNGERRILKWVAIACVAGIVVPGVFVQLSVPTWDLFSLLFLLASCGWVLYLSTREAGRSARVLLVCFILFDMAAFQWAETDKTSSSKPTEQLEQMISLRGVAGFLKAQPEPGRVRVAIPNEPNIGDAYGVQSVFGGGGTFVTTYSKLLAHERLLNVRWVVKPASTGDPGAVYQDSHWKVYENPDAYPRGWIVHKAVVESSDEAIYKRLGDPAIDLRRVAVLEAPLKTALEDNAGTTEAVRFRSYEENRIAVSVTAASSGLLVLSELHYPGWRATLNGKRTEILKVDGGLRGTLVPRGQSEITLEYVPWTIYAGGVVSLLTLLGVVILVVLNWRAAFRLRSAAPATEGSAG